MNRGRLGNKWPAMAFSVALLACMGVLAYVGFLVWQADGDAEAIRPSLAESSLSPETQAEVFDPEYETSPMPTSTPSSYKKGVTNVQPIFSVPQDEMIAVKAANRDLFWRQPNVWSVGVGLLSDEHGTYTSEVGIVIQVTEKVPDSELPAEDRIPSKIDGVKVQIRVAPKAEFQFWN